MKTINKILTILLIAFATVAGAQNNWYAPSVFYEKVNHKKEINQTSGTDSLFIKTTGPNSEIYHGNGNIGINPSKVTIGNSTDTGYRFSAGANRAEIQKGNTDSIWFEIEADTCYVTGTFNEWVFSPPLPGGGGGSGWSLTGNSGTNPATNFVGTTDSRLFNIGSGDFTLNSDGAVGLYQKGNDVTSAYIYTGIRDSFNNTSAYVQLNSAPANVDIRAETFSADSSSSLLIFKDSLQVNYQFFGTPYYPFTIYPEAIKIDIPSKGAGKVLTSDANGLASWQSPDSLLPYYKYVALLTQTDTTQPITVTVLENTIGNIVWSNSTGNTLIGSLTGAFTVGKTFFLMQQVELQTPGIVELATIPSGADAIEIVQYDSSLNQVAGFSFNIEIRVYK